MELDVKPGRILVIQTAYIGDMLFTTPMLRELRKLFPVSRISLLTTPLLVDMMRDFPYVDDFIVYDKRGKDRGLKNFFRFAGVVKDSGFDIVVSPHRSIRSGLLSKFTGAPVRVGFNTGVLSSFFYTHRVAYDCEKEKSFVKRKLSLLHPFQNTVFRKNTDCRMELKLGKLILDRAAKKLSDWQVERRDGSFFMCVMMLGSLGRQKIWPIEHFVDLTRMLINKGMHVALLGSLEEKKAADTLVRQLVKGGDRTEKIHNFCGLCDIRLSCAITSLSSVVVGADTGFLHIARAFPVPSVTLFGPTDPEQFEFEAGVSSCLVTPLTCAPCSPHGRNRCSRKLHCMGAIRPEKVYAEVVRLVPSLQRKRNDEE